MVNYENFKYVIVGMAVAAVVLFVVITASAYYARYPYPRKRRKERRK